MGRSVDLDQITEYGIAAVIILAFVALILGVAIDITGAWGDPPSGTVADKFVIAAYDESYLLCHPVIVGKVIVQQCVPSVRHHSDEWRLLLRNCEESGCDYQQTTVSRSDYERYAIGTSYP